jgi:hypothetical protein
MVATIVPATLITCKVVMSSCHAGQLVVLSSFTTVEARPRPVTGSLRRAGSSASPRVRLLSADTIKSGAEEIEEIKEPGGFPSDR